VSLALYVYAAKRSLLHPIDLLGVGTVAGLFLVPRRFAAILVAAELFALNAGFNALVKREYFRPRLPIVGALRACAPQEPFRVAGLDWMLLPNASAQYELEDIRGSDPMAFESYDAYLQRFTVQEPGTWVRRVIDPERPELDFLNCDFSWSSLPFASKASGGRPIAQPTAHCTRTPRLCRASFQERPRLPTSGRVRRGSFQCGSKGRGW
jgi:hypothetical protein